MPTLTTTHNPIASATKIVRLLARQRPGKWPPGL